MVTRNEAVRLSLIDDFTPGIIRGAAATALLDKRLEALDGSQTKTARSSEILERDVVRMGSSSTRTTSVIDKMSGRVRLLGDALISIGPALGPLGGAAIAGMAGLANQLGIVTVAATGAVIGLQGVGDGLKALADYEASPSAANLAKVQQTMDALGPSAERLVQQLFSLRGEWSQLKNTAAAGLVPGLSAAIDDLETRLPDVEVLLTRINQATGSLVSQGAEALASSGWDDFFEFLQTDGVRTLTELGQSLGAVTKGFADLWMAFSPLEDDFSDWVLKVSRSFADWADGLGATQGFQDFVAYVRQNGPQVSATLAAIADAIIKIVEAAAPLGGPVLHAIEEFAKAITALASTPLGTVVGALLALNSGARLVNIAMGGVSTSFGQISSTAKTTATSIIATNKALSQTRSAAAQGAQYLAVNKTQLDAMVRSNDRVVAATQKRDAVLRSGLATYGKTTAVVGGLALASSGLADKIHLTNTATLALTGAMVGSMFEPGIGTAIGAGIGAIAGAVKDLHDATSMSQDDMQRYVETVGSLGGSTLEGQKAAIDKQIAAIQAGAHEVIQVRASGGKAGGSSSAVMTVQYDTADAEDKLKGLKSASAELSHQIEIQKNITDADGASNRSWAETLDAQIAATLTFRQGQDALGAAMYGVAEAAGKNKDAVAKGGKAALDARTALDNLGVAWQNSTDDVKNAKGAYEDVVKQFLVSAEQMGYTRTEAEKLAVALLDLPTNINISFKTNAGKALQDAQATLDAMSAVANAGGSVNANVIEHAMDQVRQAQAKVVSNIGADSSPAPYKYVPPATHTNTGKTPAEKAAASLQTAYNKQETAIRKSESAITSETQARQQNIDKLKQFADTITERFTTNPFTAPDQTSAWLAAGPAMSNPSDILRSNIISLQSLSTANKALSSILSPDALRYLDQNASLAQIQAYAADKTSAKEFGALFGQETSLALSTARSANADVVSALAKETAEVTRVRAELADQKDLLKDLRSELKAGNAIAKKNPSESTKQLAAAINAAAAAGQKSKPKG